MPILAVEYVIQQRHNSLKLWPDNKKWKNWSLPSKLTAIGALIGILSLGLYIVEKSFDIFKWASKEVLNPEISVDLNFPYERLDGTIKQNNRNPEQSLFFYVAIYTIEIQSRQREQHVRQGHIQHQH